MHEALPSGSSLLVSCQLGGIMHPLILFHWLVKGHNQTLMGKEAGSGGGLGSSWGGARS